jgi:hypothetical protein
MRLPGGLWKLQNPVPVQREILRNGGADHARTVTLRLKLSTGQWFLWDQMLLAGIREPKSRDVWA